MKDYFDYAAHVARMEARARSGEFVQQEEQQQQVGVAAALGVASLGLGISSATSGGNRPVDPAGVGAALAQTANKLNDASTNAATAITGVQNLSGTVTQTQSEVQSQKTLLWLALGIGLIAVVLGVAAFLKKRRPA